MRETKHRRVKQLVVVLLAVFLIAIALLLLNIWDSSQDIYQSQSDNQAVVYQNTEYVLRPNVESFLFIGLDKFDDEVYADSYKNDQQADFLMLFVMDHDAQKITAVHINRDTMTGINILGLNGNKVDTVIRQIALSHTYGNGKEVSCNNTVNSVSALLNDVKINHYLSMKMDGVAVLNDLVGGVEVTVLDTIDESLIQGEMVLLMGEQALRYVRARQGLEDSSNLARMERQKQYATALYEKLLASIEKDEDFSIDAIAKLSDYTVSDRSATQLKQLVNKIVDYEFEGIVSLDGKSTIGNEYVEFYADQDAIDKLVIDLFYNIKSE